MSLFADDMYIRKAVYDEAIEALEAILEAVDRELPENPHGEGNYLDTVPFLEDAVSMARETVAKAKGREQ